MIYIYIRHIHVNVFIYIYSYVHIAEIDVNTDMTADRGLRWLWLVGSLKLQVSFAKEPYKRDDILQKRPTILSSLLTVATAYSGF